MARRHGLARRDGQGRERDEPLRQLERAVDRFTRGDDLRDDAEPERLRGVEAPANAGRDFAQSERDQALRDTLNETLAAIKRAERRLQDGSYGISIASGEPIPDARLEALPWAERRVEEEGPAQ